LRHATVSITLDTYSHAIPAMQEEAATLIAGLVFAANQGGRTSSACPWARGQGPACRPELAIEPPSIYWKQPAGQAACGPTPVGSGQGEARRSLGDCWQASRA